MPGKASDATEGGRSRLGGETGEAEGPVRLGTDLGLEAGTEEAEEEDGRIGDQMRGGWCGRT